MNVDISDIQVAILSLYNFVNQIASFELNFHIILYNIIVRKI